MKTKKIPVTSHHSVLTISFDFQCHLSLHRQIRRFQLILLMKGYTGVISHVTCHVISHVMSIKNLVGITRHECPHSAVVKVSDRFVDGHGYDCCWGPGVGDPKSETRVRIPGCQVPSVDQCLWEMSLLLNRRVTISGFHFVR